MLKTWFHSEIKPQDGEGLDLLAEALVRVKSIIPDVEDESSFGCRLKMSDGFEFSSSKWLNDGFSDIVVFFAPGFFMLFSLKFSNDDEKWLTLAEEKWLN